MTDDKHANFVAALESRSYERLFVKRRGPVCHLVIQLAGGVPHVFVDRFGTQVTYRHAWQIRDWLASRLGIAREDVPVEP